MPEPLRVAVDARALVPAERTGIGAYTRALLLELARLPQLELDALAGAPLHAREELCDAGIRVKESRAALGVLWQQLRLPRELRRGRHDLLWSPLHTLPVIGRTPSVVTIHDLTVIHRPHDHTWKVRLSQRPFLRSSLRRAARIVAISDATRRDLVAYAPDCEERVVVIPNGVDADFRPASEAAIESTRARHGLPTGYLLYVGTAEPRKNLERLIDAWQALRSRRPETPPLVLCGSKGWHSSATLERVRADRTGALLHLGYSPRAELVALVQAATAFAYPSLSEGFGLPPLEALACGVPTLTSNTSSLPEVVGSAALQVTPTEAASLERGLERVVFDDELRERLRRAGPERAAAFGWRRAATALAEVFEFAARRTPDRS